MLFGRQYSLSCDVRDSGKLAALRVPESGAGRGGHQMKGELRVIDELLVAAPFVLNLLLVFGVPYCAGGDAASSQYLSHLVSELKKSGPMQLSTLASKVGGMTRGGGAERQGWGPS